MPDSDSNLTPKVDRIASLDQFRGYTVVGMLLVNYLEKFSAVPPILKHHNSYCSYADTIMPQFFFAVGYAFRLTSLKRAERDGTGSATRHAIGRNLGLLLLGLVFHQLDGEAKTWVALQSLGLRGFFSNAFQREPFQTLVSIALASLWCLPVIRAAAWARLLFLVATALLHLWLSAQGYFAFAWNRPVIDGGALGFLSWSIPLLVGTFAYDLVASGRRSAFALMLVIGASLMGIGYALSNMGGHVPPPFVAPARPVDLWMMSQRAGSVSYLTFAAGFSIAVFAAFVVVADWLKLRFGVFRTFGRNALATYLVHPMVYSAVKPYAPADSPLWYAFLSFGLAFGIVYLFMRHLEKEGVYLRL